MLPLPIHLEEMAQLILLHLRLSLGSLNYEM